MVWWRTPLQRLMDYGAQGKETALAATAMLKLVSGPPFETGARVIDRDRPEDGWVEVTGCDPAAGDWVVHYRRRLVIGSSPAGKFVPCPEGWIEFPERPYGEVDRLLRSSTLEVIHRDGRRAWAEQHFIDEARKRDLESGYVGRLLAYYREDLVRWWAVYASCVNPELGREQAVGIAKMADLLEEEARAEAHKWGISF